MRFKRHAKLEKGNLDIAPLIDVVLLLLIFFMLTSSFISQPGIRINLPKAVTSEAIHEESLVITITDKNIYLGDKKISLKDLKSSLKFSARRDQPLLIKADEQVALGKVVEVWDLCRDAGISRINIATTPKEK